MSNFKLDLNILEETALERRTGRRSGQTTLFIYDLIGVALLDRYNFNKVKQPIYILFTKPINHVLDFLNRVQEVCEYEKIPCGRNGAHYITVLNTVYAFVRIGVDSGMDYSSFDKWALNLDYVVYNSDLCWKESDRLEDIDLAHANSVSICPVVGIHLDKDPF